MYKQLISLFRIIHNKWIINIPEKYKTENKNGLNELIHEWNETSKDIKLMFMQHSNNTWILPNVVLTDDKKLQNIEENLINSGLVLIGNGDVEKEGYYLKQKYINNQSWIYWPKHTKILEKIIKNKLKNLVERKFETKIIGNKINDDQKK